MLRRRWYAVLLGLAATAGLCGFMSQLVPVTYTAQAQILLLPPKDATASVSNPYLNLSGMNGVSDALARSMTDASTQQRLVSDGATSAFTVEPDAIAPGPVVDVTATGAQAVAVVTTLNVLVREIPQHLESLQSSQGVTTKSLITYAVLSKDTAAAASAKGQLRAMLVALAAGIAFTWLGTGMLDALLRRRRSSRNVTSGTATDFLATSGAGPMPQAPQADGHGGLIHAQNQPGPGQVAGQQMAGQMAWPPALSPVMPPRPTATPGEQHGSTRSAAPSGAE
jgi:hypothetical protein